MRQRTLLALGITLTVVGLLGLAGMSVFVAHERYVGGREVGSSGAGAVEAMFIEQMVPHHQDAIDMADLALERATHPEIRQLAARIKSTQTAENEQMRRWYQEWFDAPVPDVGDRGMMGWMMRGTDLERLRNAPDFDKEFIEQMVPHHRMAIMMSRMVVGRSTRPELRRLGESIIETQAQEIRDMQRWYREWYGR